MIETFFSSRGLKQRDPISPYLFVLYMERLGQGINEAIQKGSWKPIALNKGGPNLFHLFFTNDLIIFAEANIAQARVINDILTKFCDCSSQKINRSKTQVIFSNNMIIKVRKEISKLLGVDMTDDLGKYLGVPLLHSKVTKKTF